MKKFICLNILSRNFFFFLSCCLSGWIERTLLLERFIVTFGEKLLNFRFLLTLHYFLCNWNKWLLISDLLLYLQDSNDNYSHSYTRKNFQILTLDCFVLRQKIICIMRCVTISFIITSITITAIPELSHNSADNNSLKLNVGPFLSIHKFKADAVLPQRCSI